MLSAKSVLGGRVALTLSFNIVGFSSPLLPCRPADLRDLIYNENLQHLSLLPSHSPYLPDCTSATNSPLHHLECSLRPTSSLRITHFVIAINPFSGELEPTWVIDLS